jgi:excisionase family DNA binding protein
MAKNEPEAKPDLIKTSEAARILGVHVSTVARMVATGKLPYAVKVPGETGAYLFSRETVEAAKAA